MIFVAVYRVNKNRGYTVMANFHLRDKSLSLKAVGLLSKMLSFNDGWKFSTKGLSAICKEGPDAILSALRELETHGYLVRHRQRDGKGRMSNTIFEIYEEPQESTPEREMPHTENPCVEKPDVDNPHGDMATHGLAFFPLGRRRQRRLWRRAARFTASIPITQRACA